MGGISTHAFAEAAAGLERNPAFAGVVYDLAERMTGIYRADHMLNLVLNDRGRLLVSLLAQYLDAIYDPATGNPGLTTSRLVGLCVEYGVCSPGRAAAMVGLMQLAGFLAPAPAGPDRRVRRLAPTERLHAAQRRHWRTFYEALAAVHSPADLALDALGKPSFERALVVELVALFRQGCRPVAPDSPLRDMVQRKGGMILLLTLVLETRGRQGPDRLSAPLSVAALARKLGVSRVHVIHLLKESEAAGLLRRSAGGARVELSPALIAAVSTFFARGGAVLILAAAEAGVAVGGCAAAA